MPKKSPFVGLDIGSTKVACVTGIIQEGLINIIAVAQAPNSGMRKGMIVDIEDTVSAVSGVLEQTERMAGFNFESAYVGLGGNQITTTNSKGIIAVSRADGEITPIDINRVIEAARAVALPPNKEIIHVIPQDFIIDGQEGIKDPVNMVGVRLEVETIVIGASVSNIRNLTKCVHQAGLNIEQLYFTPLASARALLSKKQRENGVIVIDIGGGTTGIAVYEEGELVHTNVLPIGSINITNDIALGIKTSPDIAEQIKLKYGSLQEKPSGKINLSEFDPAEKTSVEKKLVEEIIKERIKEIFDCIRQELKSIGKDALLPAGAILTGGGVLIEGIVDVAKNELNLPTQIGYPVLEVAGMVDRLDNPTYTVATGLMLEAIESRSNSIVRQSPGANLARAGDLGNKIKDWLKQFLP